MKSKICDCLLVLTGVQSGVLLDVRELLEAAVAVAALVRLLAGVHPDVLHQLVVGAERLEALLTLVRLDLGPRARHEGARAAPGRLHRLPRVHLHRRLVHEDLQGQNKKRTKRRVITTVPTSLSTAWLVPNFL